MATLFTTLCVCLYLAMPWIYVGISMVQNVWFLRRDGRGWKQLYLATGLYVKVRDTLDMHHWPEALRTRNDMLRRILLVTVWPLFLDMLADDIRAWRQFVHVHTFDERPLRYRRLMECATLCETIGDDKGATEYRARAILSTK